ncbi:type IV pilus biogenesis protein PilP [Pseudomonas sp. MWU13-3659]|uniref:type IV pilus biogenesis protein PilP n=1 Tax=Pseudomonas sp. MWU13-3659 TaxID=2986964 RepID=UPI0020753848|nr:type IV pilus biogenesis protein PilP [Pseudomonas sp. MWU13-3659]
MQNNLSLVLLSLLLPIAGAQAAESGLSGISVGELGRVQSETILLKAKAERTKAEREAAGPLPEPQQAATLFPGQGYPSSTPTFTSPRQPALPVVKEISGSGLNLRASLVYSDGSVIDAKPGSELPDGFRVQQITLDGVVVGKDGKRLPLGFGNRVGVFQPQPSLPGLIPGQP